MAVCLQVQSVFVGSDQRRLSARWNVVAGVALFAALALRVWTQLEVTELQRQLSQERQLTVTLDMERRELELQRSLLLRPDSLARSAREKNGLVEHAPHQTVKVVY
jgi:hypothetical protein